MNDPGGRYKKRAAEGRRRAFMMVTMVVGLCSLSYWWGGETVRSNESAYQHQAKRLQSERGDLEQEITKLRAEVQSTQVRYHQLEEKYKQEVPTGTFKTLADLVKTQLSSGIAAERLTLAIESARPPRNCTEPAVKRFVMKTPVYSGPHGSVTFANGMITVTGLGVPAVGSTGKPEAWYDSGKPVSITFIETGGKETVKTGLLPIRYSVVSGSREYRFTVAAGERSFISVTSDSCDYP